MPKEITESTDRTSRYLLVVDSAAGDLFVASMLLQRFNYHVCTACTAGQALEMVSVAVPSLVLANFALPGMSGMDLFTMLKQDARTASVPVLFLHDKGDSRAERRSIDSGAAGSLEKPLDPEKLYQRVQAAIEATPRANIRINTSLVVSVNEEQLDHIVGDCASVLSEHGLYVRTRKPYPKHEIVRVQVILNGKTIPAEATVLYSHVHGNGPFGEPGMGLKFKSVKPEDRELIRTFIRSEVTRGILP